MHDNDGTRLSCRQLICHSASFLSPLVPPSSRHPFSAESVGVGASSPYSSDMSPDTDPRSGYCMSTRTFHSMRASSFTPSSDVPFVFPAFALFFLPNLLPRPRSQPRADRCSSTRVGLAPGFSPCMPPRRTRWRLPCLGYLGNEESRSEILNNQGL
jgi:hypothetical protein